MNHQIILDALTLNWEQILKKNIHLNAHTEKSLELLAKNLAENPNQVIEFVTGMGISKDGYPQRLPVIMIPTIRIMERLHALGVTNTCYTIYQARNFLAESEWLNHQTIENIGRKMFHYLNEYGCRLKIPKKVRDTIQFDMDRKIPENLIEEWVEILKKLESPEMEKIIAYAQSKWKDITSAYRYAVANIIGNHNLDDAPSKITRILIGWAKERPFFNIGKTYETHLWIETKIIPLIQSTWYLPPYYTQPWESVSWDYSKCEKSKKRHLKYDYQVLTEVYDTYS